jgi:IS30 family transposase
MRHYKQLTQEDRIEMYAMKQAGNNQTEMAQHLGVHRSTISRELARNTGQRGYRPQQAHRWAQARQRSAGRAYKMTPQTIAYIEGQLRREHSPEQIAGRMKADPHYRGPTVSHERIYQHLWQDQAAGGDLYLHLRIAGKKKKRKRYGKRDFRGKIPNRVGIEQRPKIVETKQRLGDWEADTILGKHHRGAVVSLVERKSQFTVLGPVRQKTASAVQQQMVQRLRPHRHRVHTLTTDNGREFADHETIARKLHARVYFADPYCAWQRGLNENINGLIRQYLPKQTDLRDVTEEQLQFIMDRLNHRPRRTLGFKTPYEVFLNHSRWKPLRVALES